MIQLNNITVLYGNLRALDDVTLNLKEGTVGLLGLNGAGKSTLLKTLLGFLTPASGAASVLGLNTTTQRLKIRQEVGYMPENDCYIPDMNAVTFVAYAGQLCGMSRVDSMQRAHEILYYVGLGEARYRNLETYSVGMKQRIKMAQALVHDPKLLFLDEPTNGMDPKGRQEMLDLIRDISYNKGINIILSSHLLPDVEYTCKDVAIIHQGRFVIQGNIEQLKGTNQNLFEVKLKGDRQGFLTALQKAGCQFWEPENDASEALRVSIPAPMTSQMLFKIAAENSTQIRHLVAIRHSLEDIFAQALGEV